MSSKLLKNDKKKSTSGVEFQGGFDSGEKNTGYAGKNRVISEILENSQYPITLTHLHSKKYRFFFVKDIGF